MTLARLRAGVWFDLPVLALALSGGLGLSVAWKVDSAIRAVAWLWGASLLYLLLSRVCQPRRRWYVAAGALVAAGVSIGLYVLLQYASLGYEVKYPWIAGLGQTVGGIVPRLGTWTPMSNSVATALEGLVPLAIVLAMSGRTPGVRLAGTAGAAVMAIGLLLAASRGAWLALAGGAGAAALAWLVGRFRTAAHRTGRAPAGTGLVSLIAVGLALVVLLLLVVAPFGFEPGEVGDRFGQMLGRPDRAGVYRHSLALAGEVPFTGVGPGDQFAMALSRFALLIQVPFLTYAHSLLLSVWLELGLAGLLAWALLVGTVVAAILASERAGLGLRLRGTWVGILVVLLHGLSDARQVVDRWTWLPLFALLGLAAARLRRTGAPVTPLVLAVPVCSVLLCAAAVAPALWPLGATWHANVGVLAEARAELGEGGADMKARGRDEARRRFETALRIDPTQPTARRRLGLLAMGEGRFEEARAHLEVAWRADSAHPAARKAFGLALAWTGRTVDAAALLAPIEAIVEELNVWSWHWERQGRSDQAVFAARVSLAIQPSQPEVARRLAVLERRLAG